MDCRWVTRDNRRLWVFRQLERLGQVITVPVYQAFSIPPAKLTSVNNGRDVYVRRSPGGFWHNRPSRKRETPRSRSLHGGNRQVHNTNSQSPRPFLKSTTNTGSITLGNNQANFKHGIEPLLSLQGANIQVHNTKSQSPRPFLKSATNTGAITPSDNQTNLQHGVESVLSLQGGNRKVLNTSSQSPRPFLKSATNTGPITPGNNQANVQHGKESLLRPNTAQNSPTVRGFSSHSSSSNTFYTTTHSPAQNQFHSVDINDVHITSDSPQRGTPCIRTAGGIDDDISEQRSAAFGSSGVGVGDRSLYLTVGQRETRTVDPDPEVRDSTSCCVIL